jgi:hypothetical protein
MMAATRLRNLLLLTCFTATLTLETNWLDITKVNCSPGTDCRQLGGADGASSARGPTYPVCLVLTHFGLRECNLKRRAWRRLARRQHSGRAGSNLHTSRPAIHLALPHQLTTTTTPAVLFLSASLFCHKKSTIFNVFCMEGFYFALLLLRCADVESNPGPFDNADKEFLSKLMDTKINPLDARMTTANESLAELKDAIGDLRQQRAEDAEKLNAVLIENQQLKEKISALENKIEKHDSQLRRKNCVVYGIPDDGRDFFPVVEDIFFNKMEINKRPLSEMIEYGYRIGKVKGRRPILLQFVSESRKEQVMRRVGCLKGTKVVFADDRTPEEQRIRKVVVQAHKEAQNLGFSSRVRRNGLFVNGKLVPHNELSRPGWAGHYLQERLDDDGAGESETGDETQGGAETQSTPESPKGKKRRRGNRSTSKLDTNATTTTSKPQDGPSTSFAPPPLISNNPNKPKPGGKPQRGTSLERLRSAGAKASDSEGSQA